MIGPPPSPSQLIEFHLILSVVSLNMSIGIFKRLLVVTVVMTAFGYTRGARIYNPWLDFVGMGGLEYISYKHLIGQSWCLG